MSHTTQPRTRLLGLRLPLALYEELDAIRLRQPPLIGGRRVTLSDVARAALELGVRALKRQERRRS